MELQLWADWAEPLPAGLFLPTFPLLGRTPAGPALRLVFFSARLPMWGSHVFIGGRASRRAGLPWSIFENN